MICESYSRGCGQIMFLVVFGKFREAAEIICFFDINFPTILRKEKKSFILFQIKASLKHIIRF